MRLTIIRHADPDYDNDTITPAGHREAESLVPRLLAAGITHVYSSPMGRARITAEPFLTACGLEAVCLPWIAEWGYLHCPAEKLQLWDLDPRVLRGDEFPEQRCDDGPAKLARLVSALAEGSDALLRTHGLSRKADGRLLGDTGHLQAAGLPVLPRGLKANTD